MNDYISREAAKQILSVLLVKDAAECACNLIDSVFPADVEPVRRWIPCSERLPEHSVRCLCYCNGEVRVLKYWRTQQEFQYGGRERNVTHWMPLPEPPEEEGTEK